MSSTTPIDFLELVRARPSLNLFPTENRMSPRALQALACDAVHRYPTSEGPDFFYGDTLGLSELYERCSQLACAFFGVRFAFVNLLSGLHAMHAVVSTFCKPGDRVFIMDPDCGGHYATGTICESYGYRYECIPFDRGSCLVDVEALERLARKNPPQLVYLDMSTIVRLPQIGRIRQAVGPEALICLDASHILGLLPATPEGTGLDFGGSTCSGSTHKSFPGPQKGIFLTDDSRLADRLRARLPFVVSSGHCNSVAALAITLEELLDHREHYASMVVRNARAFARCLAAGGFDVPGEAFGYTETHQVWIAPPASISAIDWGKRLLAANVRSTVVNLPVNGRPGLRLGVQELTRMGMGEQEMENVADILKQCLLDRESPERIQREVAALSRTFPTPRFIGGTGPNRGSPDAMHGLEVTP